MARPIVPWRRAACPLAILAVLVLLASCGGDGDGDGDGAGAGAPATAAPSSTVARPAGTQAAPRWETVATLRGTGPGSSPALEILAGAIQWRARWTCETGSLEIATDPPPRRPRPLVSGACPGKGEGFAIHTGSIRLDVAASGPWEVIVDQQVDTPLEEAALPGMEPANLLAEGSFAPLEMRGTGVARLYRLPDGRAAVRFEGFETSSNTDLFVWLSEADDPRTSSDAVAAGRRDVGNLKSTLGSQNYVVPDDLALDKVRSIVIWCQPVSIAYTAAPLARRAAG